MCVDDSFRIVIYKFGRPKRSRDVLVEYIFEGRALFEVLEWSQTSKDDDIGKLDRQLGDQKIG